VDESGFSGSPNFQLDIQLGQDFSHLKANSEDNGLE
jgi:hypothetical protein